MLSPEVAGRIWREHFDNVTRDEFVATMRQANSRLAEELWGPASSPVEMDPRFARMTLREYYTTAADPQRVDNLRRNAPELAARWGLDARPGLAKAPRRSRGVRGFLNGIGRSVMRRFS